MTVALVKPSAIIQNCYVVPDLDLACAQLSAAFGIGPFIGGNEFTLDEHVYRGAPQPPIRARGALVQSGELNVELIQVLSDGPSAFHDMFPRRDMTGCHHVAMYAEDDYVTTRDRFIAAGYPVASEFVVTPIQARICYIDTRPLLGHMLELYPENAGIRGMYAYTREASEKWDRSSVMISW